MIHLNWANANISPFKFPTSISFLCTPRSASNIAFCSGNEMNALVLASLQLASLGIGNLAINSSSKILALKGRKACKIAPA